MDQPTIPTDAEAAVLEAEAAYRAHLQLRPEPKGGWVSQLSLPEYRAYMKRLSAWQDERDWLKGNLDYARVRGSRRVVVMTFEADPEEEAAPKIRKVRRPAVPTRGEIQAMEAEHDALVAAYVPGDRRAYIKIRNLRHAIATRYERLGELRTFDRLPKRKGPWSDLPKAKPGPKPTRNIA